MSKVSFNDNWSFMYQYVQGNNKLFPSEQVTLPHDAVITLDRYAEQPNGNAKGFFPNTKLLYAKKFQVSEEMRGKYIALQFDGVYRNVHVMVNGNFAGKCNNGYQRFYVDIYPYLNYGGENEVTVEVSSGDDARWYTGTGIYRNVYLITAETVHLANGGVKVKTKEADKEMAVLEAKMTLVNDGFLPETVETITEIIDIDGKKVAVDRRKISIMGNGEAEETARIYLKTPKLWSVNTPNLYSCRVRVERDGIVLDETDFHIGIRTITLDPVRGFCINGENLKLYGGCIHHDNGIVGCAAFKAAEYRKVRLLKEAGYNALRFAHNPMSEELMDACDYYGVVVMDELSDTWDLSKTSEDHSKTFEDDWKQSVSSLIDKAYNHPCVVMYSVGNEIKELGMARGRELGRKLVNEFRKMDDSRYITSGVNGLVCMMPPATVTDPTQGNPEEINAMMSQMMEQMGAMQCMDVVVEATREFSETLDIVGYNYAEDKQLLDTVKFTNRICVGSETFPKAIAKNWKLINENPNIIGDFSWTAWDYIGEAGIAKNGEKGDWTAGLYEGYPYKLANCGDFDIAGLRRTQSVYRECVIGARKIPYIAVVNPVRYGQKIDTTPWSWSDSVSSWSWDGFEGKPIEVEVYGVGDEVELIINGTSLGRKDIPQVSEGKINAYCTVFDVIYEPGTIEAVLYKNGEEQGRYQLATATDKIKLTIHDQNINMKDEWKDLLYYEIHLTDENGIVKVNSDRKVKVIVEGDGKLQGFGTAAPISTENFGSGEFTTYYGKAVLAIRPIGDGEIRVCVETEGCETIEFTV